MSSNNLCQYATIFAAFGCQSAYNSSDATISIVDVPKGTRAIVDKALSEIKHFDDTKNYVDGMAALCLSNTIDGVANPINETSRLNILHALGIMESNRYIHQVLMLQKNNRSWHYSDIANNCSWFGEECTHRGVNPNPERKGRRSNRQPEDYHVLNAKEEINREQLVTDGLETLFQSIPSENLISMPRPGMSVESFDLRTFKKLPLDKQLSFISDLQEQIA